MVDVKALIEKQRASAAKVEPTMVSVEIAGEVVEVGVLPILGDEWQDLVAKFPPRPHTSDENLGFNQKDIPSGYPAESLTLAGEPVDAETWADFYGVLASPSRNLLASTMWGLNVMEPMNRLRELGKALADAKSASPVNRASRRAASKGGSQRSARSTSTTKTDA